MSIQRKGWLSLIAGGALLTLSNLTMFAASGFVGTAAQGAKGTPKAASSKEEAMFPHMDQALAYLRAAQREVREAEPVFGGHRENALGHVNAAIDDVQAGINEYMAKHPSATRNQVNPDTIEVKMGYHFPEALRLTQQAQTELNRAESVYYGKREAALNDVKAAIAEMQAGLEYYKARHPQK